MTLASLDSPRPREYRKTQSDRGIRSIVWGARAIKRVTRLDLVRPARKSAAPRLMRHPGQEVAFVGKKPEVQ